MLSHFGSRLIDMILFDQKISKSVRVKILRVDKTSLKSFFISPFLNKLLSKQVIIDFCLSKKEYEKV